LTFSPEDSEKLKTMPKVNKRPQNKRHQRRRARMAMAGGGLKDRGVGDLGNFLAMSKNVLKQGNYLISQKRQV